MKKETDFARSGKHLFNDRWVWKMAWLDARSHLNRLFLFISSIVLGIAGLVAINSFHINLQYDIDDQAKDLLGADFMVRASKPIEKELIEYFDSLDNPQSREASFASMVLFLNSGQTRLIRVVASKGDFPYYGKVETRPENTYQKIYEGPYAVLDENLASQFTVSTEDSIKIGNMVFYVAGEVVKIPGGSGMSSTFTPSIYINMDHLDSTGLVQYGSRVNYRRYFKTSSEEETERLTEMLDPELRKYGHRIETVEGRKEDLGKGFQNMYKFFNLLAFVALIMGCVGIASSIYIYAREKRAAVAVLRCLGASGWQSFNVFMVQTVVMGMIGSVLGVLGGLGIQFGLPRLLEEFIPMTLTMRISWLVVAEGLVLGFVVSVLFSVLPLLYVRFVPPLSVLRSDNTSHFKFTKTGIIVAVLTVLFPMLFATYQSKSIELGLWFFAGLLTAFLFLTLMARLLMRLTRKYFPKNLGFVWKQGLSNLFRPNNQTTVMVVVIGLGAFLVATMYIVQTSLLNQVEFTGQENKSNTILFDVQPHQREGIIKLTEDNGLPVQQVVPIVTCRLASINGKTIEEIQQDTTDGVPNWALTREYRVTYRDILHHSEELLEGEVQKIVRQDKEDSVKVTISQGMQENLEVSLGDSLVFDVQGVPIRAVVGGVREVDWPTDPPNFIFVFPGGVLEQAPQIYVLTTRVDAQTVADKYSRELVALFPNVSLIDLRLVLSTIQEFFDKVSFVIKFMALFSIITGLIVLAGAVINSKYARMRENVLLRTVGALKKQIVGLTLLEYSYLGLFAGIAGILLSLVSGYLLSLFMFDVIFLPDISGLFVIWLGVILLTVSVGWLNTRSIMNNSPLEVLRKQ